MTALSPRAAFPLVCLPIAALALAAALSVAGCGSTASPLQALGYDLWGAVDEPPMDGAPGDEGEPGLTATDSNAGAPYEVQSVTAGDVVERGDVPVLEVSVDELDFGDAETALEFEVHNAGGGTMEYVVSGNRLWISVSPESGTNQGAFDRIRVQVDRTGLPSGDDAGLVTVSTSDGQSHPVAVWLIVPPSAPPSAPPPGDSSSPPVPPTLEVSTARLDFGPTDEELTLTVQNTGDGTLVYSIVGNADWVTVAPDHGALTGGAGAVVAVVVHRDTLVTGPHNASLTIAADTGASANVTVLMTKRVTSPLILPYIEVGAYENMDQCVAAPNIWRQVTDTAVVVLYPGCQDWYAELRERVPGLTIIPGLKTEWALGYGEDSHFESPEGWQALATEVSASAAATGQSRVFLEMEWSLETYWNGTYDIDLGQLQQSLASMPAEITILWYPAISYCHTQWYLDRGVALCQAVAQALNVQFMDHSWGAPGWLTWPPWLQAREELAALSINPPVPLCWFECVYVPDGSLFCYWLEDQAHTAMDALHEAGQTEVLFVCGQTPWVPKAQDITADLEQNDGAWK